MTKPPDRFSVASQNQGKPALTYLVIRIDTTEPSRSNSRRLAERVFTSYTIRNWEAISGNVSRKPITDNILFLGFYIFDFVGAAEDTRSWLGVADRKTAATPGWLHTQKPRPTSGRLLAGRSI